MDEAKSVVSNLLSPCGGTDVSVPRKKDSSSVINKDEDCSISPIARENEKKNQRKEICSVYSGQKPTVYINPIVQTESPLTDSSLQMDITINQPKIIESSVSSIGMQPVIEVLNEEGTDIHQELVVSETTEKNRPKTDRRRRQRGTIVWEPLLVPSEMDGKIEMVTALKRVDSDYISTPRTVPKKHDIHLVKPSTFRPSPKALLSPVLPIKSSKPLMHKVPENSDNSHHSLSVSKSRASGSNIKVQMNKAIAEKEASILKEIETAMREAAKLKNKSSLQSSSVIEAKVSCISSEQPRPDAVLKITPSLVSKRKKTTTEIPSNSGFDGSNQSKGLFVTAEGSFPTDISCLPDNEGMFVGDSVNDVNDKKHVIQAPGTVDGHQTSSSKDIITTFGAVVTSSATNDGNELHGMHKILTLPSKVTPTLTNVTKDLNPINRIVASTTNINSKSPSSLQRILLLTTPGGKNVNGDNITHIPIAPIISSPSTCASNAKRMAKENKVQKNTVNATENPQDVHLVMANLPVACEKSIQEEGSSHAVQTRKIVSKKNLSSQSHNSHTGNIRKELPSKKNIIKSFPKKKQKTDKPKNRELASLVIDCVNAPTPTKSVLRTRTNRLLPKSSEDKSRFNAKVKSIKGSATSSSEVRKTTDQKSPVAKLKNTSQEQGHALDKKRQKMSSCIKVEKKDSDGIETLKERLARVEQLYNELPPCQPYISLSPDDYSKVRDTIRGNLQDLNFVSESMKSFIRNCDNGEFSLPNKGSGNMGIKVSNCKSEDFKGDHILCRLCGGLFIKHSVIALFSDFGKEKNLSSMFSAILPQSPPFRELDGLPQHVCLTCTDKLTLCFNIINQFLQADKELRNVLHEKKEDSVQVAEIENETTNVAKQSMVMDVNATSDNLCEEKNQLIVNDPTANCKKDDIISEKPNLVGSGKGKRKRSGSQERDGILDMQKLDEYQEHSESESKRLCTVNPPNHKHKRKRSKSPRSNKKVQKPSPLSKTPSGCIDLSRLDPEFNDGYEVEWCLDEETIRSSLMPDENTDEDDVLNPITPGPSAHDFLKHDDNPEKTQTSSVIRPRETSTDSSVSRQKKDPIKKDECLGSEKLKPADEVSKLSETRSSVCEPSVTSGGEQNPLASSEDKSKTRHFNLFHSQETVKCSSCPLSFPTKQEAFLHKVMKHEEELMSVIKPQYSKLYSGSAKRTKDSPKNVELSNDSSKVGTKKIESGLIQDSKMCDECGLAFPNEYSLYIHKCVIHDTYADSQSKDAKGVEYKIINSKELAEEIEAHNTTEETDGKILVKCGSGMLWVSSSKLICEEPKTSAEALDRNGVSNVSVENGILSVESSKPSVFSDSSQDTTESP